MGTKYVRIMKKLHFEEEKDGEHIYHVKKLQYLYLLNKYTNATFRG
jgi:hypothetical protein